MTPSLLSIDLPVPFKIDGIYCRLISLTQGQYVLVWASDYEYLMQWKWQAKWSTYTKSFYAVHSTGKATIRMHRVLLGLTKRSELCDHKNRITLDNRRENIRVASYSENQFNTKLSVRNTSGFKGVYWVGRIHKWAASIFLNGRSRHLGYFFTLESAAEARAKAVKEFHGEFARLM